MKWNIRVGFLVLVAGLGGGVETVGQYPGGGPSRVDSHSPEEKRAEALRTVYRRFSSKASTSRLKLSTDAKTLVDLILDLDRNQEAVARGEAPPSRIFHGPAHGVIKRVGDRLVCKVVFVNLVIAETGMPLSELPALVETALHPKRLRCARYAGERRADFGRRRLLLLTRLCCKAADDLVRTRKWKTLGPRVVAGCLAALAEKPTGDLHSRLLQTLVLHGDDTTATALIKRLEGLGDKGWGRVKLGYLRTICRIPGKVGRDYRLRALDHRAVGVVVTALGTVPATAGPRLHRKVIALVVAEPPVQRRVFDAALSALTRLGGKTAIPVLEKVWRKATDEDRKYALACALTRSGSTVAVPWLKQVLIKLQSRGDIQSLVKATVLKTLLAKHL